MTEELNFEVYLSISQKKFGIYLLDKKNLKNIYKEELYLKNDTDLIDYNLLINFLDNNIFKIEKSIGKFLKNIVVVIDNNKILEFLVGIKKKISGEKINKEYLESSLMELKDLFKKNYQNYRIMHFIINRYLIDGTNYTSFNHEIEGSQVCLEVKFICLPNILIKEIGNILEKYQIKINNFFHTEYIKTVFKDSQTDLPEMVYKIQSGYNSSEIVLVSKSTKKKGFFEKFFQLFS